MNREVKAAWLAALRSGAYPQGTGYLHITQATAPDYFYPGHPGRLAGWCCLGVLCDLAEKAGVVTSTVDDYSLAHYGAAGQEQQLPAEVWAWAGLDEDDARTGATVNALMEYNDDVQAPFSLIADAIEVRL